MRHAIHGLGLAMAAGALMAWAEPSQAAECREVTFADQVKVGEAPLVLNGLGLRKATLLKVKVYVAGLYLPQKVTDSAMILSHDQDWRLVLRFVRDVDAGDIRDAFSEGYENVMGEAGAKALAPRIQEIGRAHV